MITVVPNMSGLTGLAQKLFSEEIFSKHLIFTPDSLRCAHEDAGLSIVRCNYMLFTNFGVVNPGAAAGQAKKLALTTLRAITGLSWAIESLFAPLPPNAISSPYIFCVSQLRTVALTHKERATGSAGNLLAV